MQLKRKLIGNFSKVLIALMLFSVTSLYACAESKEASVRSYKLMRMQNRVADHRTPDALVYLSSDFDKRKPINLLLYNHGLTNNVVEAAEIWNLPKHLSSAPSSTILILPEWAEDPEAYSSKSARFHQPGFFRNMLLEIISKVPELQGTTIDDIERIGILTYSGGYRATASQIHNNGLGNKIYSVSLLDSLYRADIFDRWLEQNIQDLAVGRKQFHNFFYDTHQNSQAQLSRVRSMLSKAGVKNPLMVLDLSHPKQVMSSQTIAQHGIVFKFNTLKTLHNSAHMSVAHIYLPQVMQALKQQTGDNSQLSAADSSEAMPE